MNLENQVCTIEQSKKLKELGVEYEGFFTWLEVGKFDENGGEVVEWVPLLFYEHGMDMYAVSSGLYEGIQDEDGEFHETRGNYPAFTVAELGVMLSLAPEDWAAGQDLEPATTAQIYNAEWVAKCVIYLLENKLITPEQVNNSLTQQQ